jgi:endonuclease-3 related protein
MIEIYHKLLKIYGKQNWWPIISQQNAREEIIIGAILTQNTSWNNVEKALKNLIKNHFVDFNKILSIEEEKLKELIRPAGFFNQKASTIRRVAKFFLMHNYENITREELLSIKGIGKETADSILLYAFNQPYFVIDTYTKRLFFRLGLIKENISYNELHDYITKNIPKNIKIYKEFHALIVIHCKNICKKKPMCSLCELKKECPFYKNFQP